LGLKGHMHVALNPIFLIFKLVIAPKLDLHTQPILSYGVPYDCFQRWLHLLTFLNVVLMVWNKIHLMVREHVMYGMVRR
jgi:hypothetical protein